MINGRDIFDRHVKNNARTYNNIRKIAIGQRDDYEVGYLLDYPLFKKILVVFNRFKKYINEIFSFLDLITLESVVIGPQHHKNK